MISRITMFGFKSGAGYQLDRRDEKLYERYHIRAQKAADSKNNNKNIASDSFESELQKSMNKKR